MRALIGRKFERVQRIPRKVAASLIVTAGLLLTAMPALAETIGDPLGLVAIGTTPSDNATAQYLGISNGGRASGLIAISNGGPAYGGVVLSNGGVAEGNVAISNGGTAYGVCWLRLLSCWSYGPVAVNTTGTAYCSAVAVSVYGQAGNCNGLDDVAISGFGNAKADDVSASGTGSATSTWTAAISGTGNATARDAAISGLGSSNGYAAISGTGTATGGLAGVSATNTGTGSVISVSGGSTQASAAGQTLAPLALIQFCVYPLDPNGLEVCTPAVPGDPNAPPPPNPPVECGEAPECTVLWTALTASREDAIGLANSCLGDCISATGTTVGQLGQNEPYGWYFDRTETNYGYTYYRQGQPPEHRVVGSVRHTARINLNGRQSQWTQTSRAFEGPAIIARHDYNCYQDNGHRPNSPCETSSGWQTSQNGTYTTSHYSTPWNNYHSEDQETYGYDMRYWWFAQGYPSSTYKWKTPEFSSFTFSCRGVNRGPCRFRW